jgi:hypothetical protein
MGKVKIKAAGLAVWLGVVLTILAVTAAAESPARLTKAVYLTATKVCACTLRGYQHSDNVVDSAFTGSRRELLKRIDFSTDMTSAEPYIVKYKLNITRMPALLLLDAQDNLLWSAEGTMKGEEITKKLGEFGR